MTIYLLCLCYLCCLCYLLVITIFTIIINVVVAERWREVALYSALALHFAFGMVTNLVLLISRYVTNATNASVAVC